MIWSGDSDSEEGDDDESLDDEEIGHSMKKLAILWWNWLFYDEIGYSMMKLAILWRH